MGQLYAVRYANISDPTYFQIFRERSRAEEIIQLRFRQKPILYEGDRLALLQSLLEETKENRKFPTDRESTVKLLKWAILEASLRGADEITALLRPFELGPQDVFFMFLVSNHFQLEYQQLKSGAYVRINWH